MFVQSAFITGIVVGLIVGVTAPDPCPDAVAELTPFSTLFSGYDDTSDLNITVATLLDVTSLEVNTITIKGTGKLVFQQGHDITICTKGIRVIDDGALIIGSEECRHEDHVEIVLKGDRTVNRASLGKDGEKFISVTNNGTLQIHGQDKKAWTKLDGTVNWFGHDASKVKFLHEDQSTWSRKQKAISLFLLHPNLTVATKKILQFHKYTGEKLENGQKLVNRTADSILALPTDAVVAIAIKNILYYSEDLNMEPLFSAIEQTAGIPSGELLLRNVERDAYALVYTIGSGTYAEDIGDWTGASMATATAHVLHSGYKVTSVSNVHKKHNSHSSSALRVIEAALGNPTITVVDDISSWDVGDEILVASTDYDWQHGEVRTIVEKIGNNQLKLSEELEFRHFGEIVHKVDMRAEVALLTRNIVIHGKMGTSCPAVNENCDNHGISHDTYGAHIKIYESFESVFIEGAMLYHMGQASDIGHYPVHFHMCLDITGKTAIVKQNVIRNTFLRATTIHGTWGTSIEQPGVQIIDNVAYDVLGHAYFTEDGAEAGTVFIGNLGALIKRADTGISTDKSKPTVFWLTNPKILLVGNSAASSEGNGYWYTFPPEPVGPSAGYLYERKEARSTPLWRNDNNIAHSCHRTGFVFDNILLENSKVTGCMRYEAFIDPLDPSSGPAKSQITRFTAYKNRKINMWLRGGWLEMMQLSSAESPKGIQIARGSKQQMFVKKSVFLGKTCNSEDDVTYKGALTSSVLKQYVGFVFHDGPVYIESSFFDHFESHNTAIYVAAAIGFVPKKKFSTSVVANTTDVRFGFDDATNGLRVFNGQLDDEVIGTSDNFGGLESATFRDADGSISKCPGDTTFQGPVQLVAPTKYTITEKCAYREAWDMVVCTDLYGKMNVKAKQYFSGEVKAFNRSGIMKRVPTSGESVYEVHTSEVASEYIIILGSDEFYYEFQYEHDFPEQVWFTGEGVEKDLGVLMGFCLPEGATHENFTAKYITRSATYNTFTYAASLQALKDSTDHNMLYQEGRMLYIHMWSDEERNTDWSQQDSDNCPGSACPQFRLTMDEHLAYTPCFTPTEDELSTEGLLDDVPRINCTYPASDPDADWGSGSTLDNHDGNWGEWMAWSPSCCEAVEEGDGEEDGDEPYRRRLRVCDNPPPYGDGAYCPDSRLETELCPVCP